MTDPTTSGWWRAVAAVLAVALAMAGAGGAARAFATAAETLPDVNAPICYSGPGDAPAAPTTPSQGCCDACALLSPAVLPSAPDPARVAARAVAVEHGGVAVSPSASKRQRSPRQARGPPRA